MTDALVDSPAVLYCDLCDEECPTPAIEQYKLRFCSSNCLDNYEERAQAWTAASAIL